MFNEISTWASFSAVTGPILFLGGFHDLRRRRLIQNTPTAKIRSMAMGLVEVNGVVESASAVSAAFSGRPCVHWQVEIAVRSGRRYGWTTIHRNASGNPFFLRDETGLALVYPKGAECHVQFGVEETALGLSLPECYATYMKENGLWIRHVGRLGTMRFRERVLEEGQRVYVLGTTMPRPQVLAISNDEQLEATGTDGFRGSRLRQLHQEACAVVRRGDHEKTFFISQRSEKELTLDLGWKASAKLIGGPIMALFGIGWWLSRLG
jgi:hypothetical protein